MTKVDTYEQLIVMDMYLDATAGAAIDCDQFPTNFSERDRVGILIKEWGWQPGYNSTWGGAVDTNGDTFAVQLSFTLLTAMIDPADLGWIDGFYYQRNIVGAGAVSTLDEFPRTHDLRNFDNGGLIAHPAQLFLSVSSADTLATAFYVQVMMWYTFFELTEDDYQELWQAQILRASLG